MKKICYIWSMDGEIKKSNNPLKMSGSWIGLFLGLIIPLPVPPMSWVAPIFMFPVLAIWTLINGFPSQIAHPLLFFIILLLPPVSGFIIGWTVHSLIRKFKKEV